MSRDELYETVGNSVVTASSRANRSARTAPRLAAVRGPLAAVTDVVQAGSSGSVSSG